MSPAVAGRSLDADLLPLSVVHGVVRRDLAVPASVPVAALVPALLEELPGPAAVPAAVHHLCTLLGRPLDPELTLGEQGVRPGAIVVLVADGERPPRRHDDVVEAVREAVLAERGPLGHGERRAALGIAAAVLLVITVGALLALAGDPLGPTAGASALVTAAALLLGARLTRQGGAGGTGGVETTGAVTSGLVAAGLAATGLAGAGGVLLAPPGWSWVAGGSGLAVTAAAALGLLRGAPLSRAALAPVCVTGVVLAAAGVASVPVPDAPVRVLTAAVVLAALVAGAAPGWVLPAVGRPGPALLLAEADLSAVVTGAEPPGLVRTDVRAAHELLVAAGVLLGLLLAITAPVAVSAGLSASALVVAASVATALRGRRLLGRALVLTALVGGGGGLVSTTGAVLVLVPAARPWTAGGLLVLTTALAALLPTTRRRGSIPDPPGRAHPSVGAVTAGAVRLRRLAGALESLALVSLLPLLAVSSGLLEATRGV